VIRSAIVAIAAAAVLTACVGGSDPKPAPTQTAKAKSVGPKAGDCLADADSKLDLADPDFSTKVKCTKPHLYEVTGVSPVPDRFLDDPGDPKSTIKEEPLEQDGPDELSFARYARLTCSNHLWDTMGVEAANIRSGRTRLSEIGAFPAVSGVAYRHTLTPEPKWSKGEHELICFAEFRDPAVNQGPAAPTPVSSYNLKPVAEKFLSSHFPSERRRCVVRSAEDDGPCTRAHDAEIIFTYNARLAFGLPFVKKAIRAGGRDDKINDRMLKVCRDVLPGLLESPIDPELFVWGWTAMGSYSGWDLPTDQAPGLYDYPVECEVWPIDEGLVLAPGTVVHRPDRPELEDRSYRSDA
jgi:hypothetical protein